MHRIDEDANVNNLFAEADPGTGALGTRVGAPWMNDVQENLCQFIEAMGFTLSKGNYTQLRDAVLALLGKANTWTAQNTFNLAVTIAGLLTLSGADVNLTKAAAQAILKTGGKLSLGTSDANDVDLVRAGAAVLSLTSGGADVRGNPLLNVARALLNSLSADPTNPPGTLWFRSDLRKLRFADGSDAQSIATEAWVAGQVGGANALSDGKGGISWGSGWSDWSNTTQLCKTASGIVVLNGGASLNSGTGSTVMTLPAGFRPTGTVLAAQPGVAQPVSHYADGTVQILSPAAGSHLWSIAFRAA